MANQLFHRTCPKSRVEKGSGKGVDSLYWLLPAQLPPAIQEMVQITARAHRQMLGDPPHHHRRLRTQARRQSQLH